MLKQLSLVGSALALCVFSRNADASYCSSNYCTYEFNDGSGSYLYFEVYAKGWLYVTAYAPQSNGTMSWKSCGVPSSSPDFATYLAIATAAMNVNTSEVRIAQPLFDFSIAQDYLCSNMSIEHFR